MGVCVFNPAQPYSYLISEVGNNQSKCRCNNSVNMLQYERSST